MGNPSVQTSHETEKSQEDLITPETQEPAEGEMPETITAPPHIYRTVVAVKGNNPWERQHLEVTRCTPQTKEGSADDHRLRIVRFVNFSEYPTRPFEEARSQVLSRFLDADVFTVGFPGASTNLDLEATKLTQMQRVELSYPWSHDGGIARTSFDSVGQAAVQALRHSLTDFGLTMNHFTTGKTVFDLYSMGCNTGTAALAYMRPDIVLLRELPGKDKPQSLRSLLGTWARYAWRGNKSTYLPDNKILGPTPKDAELTRFISRRDQLLVAAKGIAGSSIPRDIAQASQRVPFGRDSVRFVLMPGTLSRISDDPSNCTIAETIAYYTDQKVGVLRVLLGRHALLNSLPLNAEMVKRGIEFAEKL